MTMASFVEANSLSSITQLAGNPPRYPRNPTELKRPSLVLYIARVPGSRDIILTTLKPRLKIVTAEDVASSLYYLHLNLPGDRDDFNVQEDGTEVTTSPTPESVIHRKPIQQEYTMEEPTDLEHTPSSVCPGFDQWKEPGAIRSMRDSLRLPETVIGQKALPEEPIPQPGITRRPLGPRPDLAPSQFSRRLNQGKENTALSPKLMQSEYSVPSTRSPTYSSSSGLGSKTDDTALLEIFSITVIRRDPTSGAQWNIGTIQGCNRRDEIHPTLGERAKGDKPSLNYFLHLDTLGYGQFRDLKNVSDVPGLNANSSVADNSAFDSAGFDREVRLEGSRFWERSFKIHHRGSSDQSHTRDKRRLRSNSGLSESVTSSERDAALNISNKSRRCRYVFMSPWNGRCEFSTGGGGRSLKCKHQLQNPASATRTATYSEESVSVSELRFNLPSAAVFKSRSTSPNKSDTSELRRPSSLYQLRNRLSGLKPPAIESKAPDTSYAAMYPHDDDDLGVYDRLDLSLGQEKAGGGPRGTRAKLGKLIVLDEGLKMLDLIVAANMGIWWGIWEKY